MRIFGVEAGAGFIRAAVVEKQMRGTRILRLASTALEAGERNSASLGEFLRRLGFSPDKDTLAAVFPGEKVSHRVLATPLTKKTQIAQTLPFELEAKVPFTADEFVCGFIVTGSGADGSRLLAALAKNEDMEDFLGIYAGAGLDPDLVAPGPLASAAGLAANAGRDETAAVVHGGSGGVYITITGPGGEPLAFHTCGPAEEAEKIGMEIDRLMLGLARENPGIKLGAVALGGWAFGPSDAISQRLMAPVGFAQITGAPEPEAGGLAANSVEEGKAQFLAALGAAYMAAGVAKPLSLRQGRFQKTARRASQGREAAVAGVLAAAAAALWLISFIAGGISMNREYSSLKAQVREIFKTAMPEVTTIVAEKQQMMAELARLEGSARTLGVGQGRDPFLDVMLDVARSKPSGAQMAMEEMIFEPGRLILSGRTESFEKVDQYKNALEKLPWVAKARLDKAKAAAGKGEVTFRLEADVAF